MRWFTLKLYSSLESGRRPLATMDLNADVTDLRWSTSPTGFGGLECGLASDAPLPVAGYLPSPIDIPFRAHVEVWYGSRIVYEGRVRIRRRGAGGLFVGFTAEGYLAHLTDDWNRSTSATSVTSGNALQQVVQAAAAYLRFGNSDQFVDPNLTHAGGLAEWKRMTPGEMVDQMVKAGNADGYPIDIAVWELRTIWCLARVQPATPHYRIPFDPAVVTWDEDCGNMASHVTTEYGDGSSGTLTAEAESRGFLDQWGFVRKLLIPGGNISATSATALRDRELMTRQGPEVQALVTPPPGEGLRLFSGAAQPAELVRSLEWVQVGDEPMQPIVGTTVDATAETLSVELGSPSPFLAKNQNISETQAVARLQRKIDPVSGGRTR